MLARQRSYALETPPEMRKECESTDSEFLGELRERSGAVRGLI